MLLTKQCTDKARKIETLNKSRAEQAQQTSQKSKIDCNIVIDFLDQDQMKANELAPVKLKGLDLAVFSGDDRSDYEPWKAAFESLVGLQNITIGEKLLRLQGCLSGKSLTAIKDLGQSEAAYEHAKVKLENKYGGEWRLQIKYLTTLHNWPKVRSRNLKEMEEFQSQLERVLIAIKGGSDLQDQSLDHSVKEKLSEYDNQAYKFWLVNHSHIIC